MVKTMYSFAAAKYCAKFIACCVLVCVVPLSGCSKPPDDNTLFQAFNLCEALEYENAYPLIRAYLLQHPQSAVGHYLLGKYYQQRKNPALTLAKGQFDMARYLFDLHGDLSVLKDAMTAYEFQATLHCDTVLALLQTVLEAEEAGVPQNAAMPIIRLALEHARKAAYFNPNSMFIADLANTLENMVNTMTPPEPKPAPPPLPPPGQWTT